jgi:hypothetical protein
MVAVSGPSMRMRGTILELVFCVFDGNTYLQEPDQQLLK